MTDEQVKTEKYQTLIKVAQDGYEAYLASMTPGARGIPKCFDPKGWDELPLLTKGAYVEATWTGVQEPGLSPMKAYKAWCRTLGSGEHKPYHELPMGLRDAWSAFTVKVREVWQKVTQ